MAQTVLVIAPHALDEALGCGGTMARHADLGDAVYTLVLFGDGAGRDAARRVNACAAAHILGAHVPEFTGFPENRSDTIPLLEIVAAIERYAHAVKPKIVYVSHGGNLNIDHQTSFKATATALRPVPGSPVSAIYTYEILSSTDWAPQGFGEAFHPNHFVDITKQLERKIKALETYGDEMRPSPHARSLEAARMLASIRGGMAGLHAGEGFAAMRTISNADET